MRNKRGDQLILYSTPKLPPTPVIHARRVVRRGRGETPAPSAGSRRVSAARRKVGDGEMCLGNGKTASYSAIWVYSGLEKLLENEKTERGADARATRRADCFAKESRRLCRWSMVQRGNRKSNHDEIVLAPVPLFRAFAIYFARHGRRPPSPVDRLLPRSTRLATFVLYSLEKSTKLPGPVCGLPPITT